MSQHAKLTSFLAQDESHDSTGLDKTLILSNLRKYHENFSAKLKLTLTYYEPSY
ncbi:MAG: hypothetical protein KDK62_07595 [Chlamydiia bacterium]|nr:hypothetical protein [Chlamydiia bacterium]